MFDILPQLVLNAIISGSLYALMSSGLALTYGLLRILNFAHGHLMMLGAYTLFYFLSFQQYGLLASGFCCLVIMTGISMLVYNIFIRPFSRYDMILTLVTTIALSNILESLVSMGFGVNVQSFPADYGFGGYEYFGVYFSEVQLVIIISAVILLTFLGFIIHFTPFGRMVRALSEDSFAAQGVGISRQLTTYIVFTFGVLMAGFAGIMLGYDTNLSPTMGGVFTIKCFAAMILGGLGNLWGTVLGSYVLGFLENFAVGVEFWGYSLPAGYKDALSFVIILLMLLFRPHGLFGKAGRVS
ncbi:MAG TPA: branched-chain amino acid ABC transporter permease [Oligoflexia bacterium]|nr:branched-chain amino acid ABC transporter permease [Oligoflexia bacterium]HMP48443.1 branched-chain amino acid ABC transporter permease [Oligoflexia bacterium]